MKACGHVFKYGDNVDTDVIIPARYLNATDGKNWLSIVWKILTKNLLQR